MGAGLWTHVVFAAELTDMNMPVMDGRATIIAIRAINPKVKVVGSSGMSSVGGFAEAKQIGADRFVTKPYTAQSLLSVLREVIENAR